MTELAPVAVELFLGDCLEVMRGLGADSVDSIVTDPPYHLTSIVKRFGKPGSAPAQFGKDGAFRRHSTGFMGKEWDGGDISHSLEVWAEALRVAKPGAYLLAFGGTRTYHRLVCAIEDAGWEIRDTIAWVYGQGFPKSKKSPVEGWGTALKPAMEPIVVARKPLIGTVAENVLEYGTGALNIDGCRVGADGRPLRIGDYKKTTDNVYAGRQDGSLLGGSKAVGETSLGRWPANLIHDGSDEVLGLFPQTTSGTFSGKRNKPKTKEVYGAFALQDERGHMGDFGSAARFFYCAKASGAERGEGNSHPTVKPVALMRYLCRLVTPPNGVVFDPFMGSGSTGIAAKQEGFRFIGIEKEAEYVEISKKRIEHAQMGFPI